MKLSLETAVSHIYSRVEAASLDNEDNMKREAETKK